MIDALRISLEKGNTEAALHNMRCIDNRNQYAELLLAHIQEKEEDLALIVLDIYMLTQIYPKIKDADSTRLDEAVDKVEDATVKHQRDKTSKKKLNKILLNMYVELKKYIQDERGIG